MPRTARLHLLLALTVLVATLGARPAAARDGARRDPIVPGEVIVKLAPWANPRRFAESAGLRPPADGRAQIPGREIYRFTIADGTPERAKAAALNARAHVIYAEPNFLGQLPEAQKRSSWVVGGNAGEYAAQWAGERIGLARAHTVSTGAGVTIAILDTGVDLAHPALAGRLGPGHDFVDGDDTPQEERAPRDDDYDDEASAFGHGTHVAGLIALAAPGATLMPLRTLGPGGFGDLWTQALALRYAADQGADVINLSFSFGERSDLFEEVVAEVTCTSSGYADCRARSRPGAVVVAAAGNEGSNKRQWPGASPLPGIVAVGASTERDRLADFSCYGGWVPLAAPGEGVLSSVPGGEYATWSGTSMAAPLVSGVSALVRSAGPTLRPAAVIRRVVETAAEIETPVHRRLDAAAAVGAP